MFAAFGAEVQHLWREKIQDYVMVARPDVVNAPKRYRWI